MKTLKAIAFYLSLLLLMPAFTSCSDDDDNNNDQAIYSELIGEWINEYDTLIFNEDETFVWDGDTGIFSYEKGMLTVVWDHPEIFADRDKIEYYFVEISNKTLTLILARKTSNNEYVKTEDDYTYIRDTTSADGEEDVTSPIIGTWTCYYEGGYQTYTFNANGTGTGEEYYWDGSEPDIWTFTYHYDHSTNMLLTKEEDGDIYTETVIIDGNNLILIDEYGDHETYIKQ